MSVYFGKAPNFGCEVPYIASLALRIHKVETQAVKHDIGTVSRFVSEIIFLLWNPEFHCRVHKVTATGPNSETFECPSGITRPISHQFLISNSVPYDLDQNSVWSSYALRILILLGTKQIQEVCGSSWSSSTRYMTTSCVSSAWNI